MTNADMLTPLSAIIPDAEHPPLHLDDEARNLYPHHRLMKVTIFPDLAAKAKDEVSYSWAALVSELSNPAGFPSKSDAPLLKLGTFGNRRTENGALRSDNNMLIVTGIEGDYDGEKIQPQEAIALLERHGIRACVYTSPSHTDDKPRWRVLAPLSVDLPKWQRDMLMRRLNGALGGILTGESFTLSQTYYYGRVNGHPYQCLVTFDDTEDGRCINELSNLDEIAVGPPKASSTQAGNVATDGDLRAAINSAENYHEALRSLSARFAGRGMSEQDIIATLTGLMDESTTAHDARWKARRVSIPRLAAGAVRKYQRDHSPADISGADVDGSTHDHEVPPHGSAETASTAQKMKLWLNPPTAVQTVALDDFYAYLPDHRYIYRPTRELWLSEGVNGCLPPVMVAGSAVNPARWLDQNKGVEQITWAPGEPELIEGKLIREGGFIERAGARGYNLYRPPTIIPGNARAAGPWLDHLHRLYPGEADELGRWFAHRVQRPGDKMNHAIVLAGNQGVGKDTILEPVKHAVGPWNWSEIGPAMLMGRFNGWARSVIVRVSEVRDLGEVDRFAFYEHIKIYAAAPPDVLRLDEKNLREYTVPNVLGLVLTTNYGITGMYLPPDDRRHFVASSSIDRSEFDAEYFQRIYRWFEGGGFGHVAAYLREMDLSKFNPKAPPRQTAAHRAIVMANTAPEEGELADLLETLGNPEVVSVGMMRESADNRRLYDLVSLLDDPKRRRVIPHRMGEAGYDPVPNPDRKDGLWWMGGRRGAIYARRSLPIRARIEAARAFCG